MPAQAGIQGWQGAECTTMDPRFRGDDEMVPRLCLVYRAFGSPRWLGACAGSVTMNVVPVSSVDSKPTDPCR